ncbi:uncharacterized protein STEHIDRAFT_110137 [Stereum hirsutum FP-91666 SS1]|uniref:uncharacterized protein n=1 Tax=Stereum hirsutum (strain FP-91666) TaxID=721885 RepID=UPI000440AD81|nr:uncharacterized protein STEHIDRAFT_110137 [Stereum hirsutum FP-91666 SS1]EIM88394.1 hypothetical protein STEHIDRAFT_110137 [Stereum hirsutum FP-91666 SS1]
MSLPPSPFIHVHRPFLHSFSSNIRNSACGFSVALTRLNAGDFIVVAHILFAHLPPGIVRGQTRYATARRKNLFKPSSLVVFITATRCAIWRSALPTTTFYSKALVLESSNVSTPVCFRHESVKFRFGRPLGPLCVYGHEARVIQFSSVTAASSTGKGPNPGPIPFARTWDAGISEGPGMFYAMILLEKTGLFAIVIMMDHGSAIECLGKGLRRFTSRVVSWTSPILDGTKVISLRSAWMNVWELENRVIHDEEPRRPSSYGISRSQQVHLSYVNETRGPHDGDLDQPDLNFMAQLSERWDSADVTATPTTNRFQVTTGEYG